MKILIEMKHGLGDCVTMLPAIKAIRNTYPDAYIAMIVNGKANQDIFEHARIKIDKYYYISLKDRSKLHTVKMLIQLRKEYFTHGVMATMTPASKGKLLFKLLGIKHCYGEQYEGLSFLDLDNTVHFVNRNLNIIKNMPVTIVDKQPRLYVTEADSIEVKYLYKNCPVIAINIGGADKNYYKGNYVYTRAWKRESMHELTALLSNSQCEVLLLGGVLEESLLRNYKDILVKKNVHNFVNKTSIGQTMYLLSQADISIGVDTGMQHVADALGIRTLSIFGPTNPDTHGAFSNQASFIMGQCPYQFCFDTEIYYTFSNRICMNSITSKNVYDKVMEILYDE